MSREKNITDTYSYKIFSLVRKMRRYSAAEFKKNDFDITGDQWGILRLLYENAEPLSQIKIAEMVVKDTPSTSRILDILCRKKLAKRKPNKSDRRKFDVVLTADGKKLVEKVSPIVERLRANMFSNLSDEELKQLDNIILKIEQNMGKQD